MKRKKTGSTRGKSARSAPRNYYETVMPFKKGHKLSPGGKKGNKGGRPTREQAAEKKLKAETAKEVVERNALRLANRLVKDAMTKDGRRSLHVAINKLIPDAKQTIVLEDGGLLEKAIRIAEERRRGRQG